MRTIIYRRMLTASELRGRGGGSSSASVTALAFLRANFEGLPHTEGSRAQNIAR